MDRASGENPGDLLRSFLRRGASFSGRERNCCFLNTRGPQFADISAISGTDLPDDARGVALTDWDHDGDIDFWIVNRSGPQVRFLCNETPGNNSFIALRLTGKQCNRDAIGARVEIAQKGAPPQIRTLRAGDGFLSQSSKWLHFGVGQAEQIERVVIHWPGETRNSETFLKVLPGAHYQAIEGEGKLRRWVRSEVPELSSRTSISSQTELTGRTFFPKPIPLPRLSYQTLDGDNSEIAELPRGPLLVNLWASWCRPCLAELRDFVQRAEKLEDAELNVLALSLDPLSKQPSASQQAAKATLSRLGFPHFSGFATAEMIDTFQVVQDELFDQQQVISIPMSLLLDGDGNLMAIYRGRIEVPQLLADVALIDGSDADQLKAATTFPGRRYGPYETQQLSHIAHQLLEEQKLEAAQDYLQRHEGRLSKEPWYPETLVNLAVLLIADNKFDQAEVHLRRAAHLDPKLPAAQFNLGLLAEKNGNIESAIAHYRTLVNLEPQVAQGRHRLAMLLLKPKPEEAREQLEQLVRLNEDFAPGHYQLAELYLGQRKTEKAKTHFQRAAELAPNEPNSRFRLGLILYQQKKLAEAVSYLRSAHRLAPEDVQILNSLAWILATSSDPKIRNGNQAVPLAETMCERTGFEVPGPLDTLAAAYAAAGRFEEAVATAERAIRLARSTKQSGFAERITRRKQLYIKKRPYTE